jgi:hypothetical protein
MLRASYSFLALTALLAGAVPACGGQELPPSPFGIVCPPEACGDEPNMTCKVVDGKAVCTPRPQPPPPDASPVCPSGTMPCRCDDGPHAGACTCEPIDVTGGSQACWSYCADQGPPGDSSCQ